LIALLVGLEGALYADTLQSATPCEKTS